VILRYLFPFIDLSVKSWARDARILRWLTLLWLAVGLLVLFSASYMVAESEFGDGLFYFRTQLLWVFIGLIGFNTLVHVPLRYIVAIADLMLLVIFGLIIITLLPGMGTTAYGATRWVAIGSFGLQPSELIKPFLVLQSARIFGRWHQLRWVVRISWLVIFSLVLGCILLQPNLSTAALCGMVIWSVALASGLPFRYVGGAALGGLMLATISISIHDYQRRRVISFLNPWSSPSGDGYQLIQSLLAIGSGGAFGTGFGLSQQKLFYLPIQHTDFIFAVFAEEFGFIGSLLLLIFLATYATFGLRVALKAPNTTYQLVAIGIVVLLVGQALLNIGVATGALPTTGLPFPMMSYGGSSMISSLVAAGLLVRVAREGSGGKVVALTRSRPRRSGSKIS